MNPLQQQLIKDIRANGPLPFVDYMEYCLYAPGHGYYDSGKAIFGSRGDFVTAPELGSLFAGTLARSIRETAASLGHYDLLEIGAGSGRLALDILQALQRLELLPQRYRIVEKSGALKQRQQALLNNLGLPVEVEWLDAFPDSDWQGVVIANEVLDALPVEHFRLTDEGVERLAVNIDDKDDLVWHALPAGEAFGNTVSELRQQLLEQHSVEWPLPYTSEICLELSGFFADLSRHLRSGRLLFIDYGYLQQEFYHPQRHMGTLVCHAGHQGHFDLLADPGNHDITAFVDFSAAMQAAETSGLTVDQYQTQSAFLLENGIDSVMQEAAAIGDQQNYLQLAHEMKQLMLPAEMGDKFKVLQLSR